MVSAHCNPSSFFVHFFHLVCVPPFRYMSSISFWQTPSVVSLLTYLDATAGSFYFRWGDLPIHAAAMALLNRTSQFHLYQDFTYSHLTMTNPPQGFWGGIILGTGHHFIHGREPFGPALAMVKEYAAIHNIPHVGRCALVPQKRFIEANQCT